jgi:biotin-(acetyl-CoA carboxylase) ligase
MNEERVYMLIGTGVNVEPVVDESRPNAITISEASPKHFTGISDATRAFIEHVDEQLSLPLEHDAVLAQWRALAVHKPGDRIQCVLGNRTVSGTWNGIDDQGRAMLNTNEGPLAVSAGDLVLSS